MITNNLSKILEHLGMVIHLQPKSQEPEAEVSWIW